MIAEQLDRTSRLRRWWTTGICGGLVLLFAILSFSATRTKSATYDEPLHTVAGFMRRFHHDHRTNPEDPALFGLWASVPHASSSLKVDLKDPTFELILSDITKQWGFSIGTLFQTPGNNPGDSYLHRSRFMFVLLGAGLGALIAWWSWKIGGAIAAVCATAFFALDPSLLAHSGLVKNDVMLTAVMFATMLAVYRFGSRGSLPSLLGICFGCAAAVTCKFSGLLLGPLVVTLLIVRACIPKSWNVLGLELATIPKRLLIVPIVSIIAAAVSVAGIWAVYSFRFAPTADGGVIDTTPMLKESKRREFVIWHDGLDPEKRKQLAAKTNAEVDAMINSRPLNWKLELMEWIQQKRLLPQGWTYGFTYTYTTTLTRGSFLAGQKSGTGWWYYFPACIAFKTPMATLAAMLLALVVTIVAYASPKGKVLRTAGLWSSACLLVPAAVYSITALTSNLNLGIRHILPVYPYIFVGIGIAAAGLHTLLKGTSRLIGAVLALALFIETLSAWPDFLPFFNIASGGSRGGLHLLADSNLDWGQDLPALADWQKQRRIEHPGEPLYLLYFGTSDPRFYGVDGINIAGSGMGWTWGPSTPNLDNRPGVLAISATILQGVYSNTDTFKQLRESRPLAIVGGSIYLYTWPATLAK